MDEIFESCTRTNSDLAGVFEFDGETSYLYLYDVNANKNKIIGSILIMSGDPDFSANDILIEWDNEEQRVGLYIKGVLWAVFESNSNKKFGGNYSSTGFPNIPQEILQKFAQ